jgi:ankyrin repeat protein
MLKYTCLIFKRFLIIIACREDKEDIVKLLVEKNPDVNLKNTDEETALTLGI